MKITVFFAVLILAFSATANAQVDIFLDFGTNWSANIDQSATNAGVATFSAAEQAEIESIILSRFEDAYAPYLMTFSTTDPGGVRERVDFGQTDGFGATGFGSAPLDFRNERRNLTQLVFARNFGVFIDSNDSREVQIQEFATSLAGTGIHELGHSLGQRHHSAYGTAGIDPSNYDDTGGLQNQHFQATGPTGLNFDERVAPRTFSTWSKVLLEIAEGLTENPLAVQAENGDTGDAISNAQQLSQTFLPIANRNAGLVRGLIDDDGDVVDDDTDVDIYSFAALAGEFTAELWADDVASSSDQFDGFIRLLDSDGNVLAFDDNTEYDGDTFNSGTVREIDPFLLNVQLESAGQYFLEVSTVGSEGRLDPTVGGEYHLLFSTLAVPEPNAGFLLILASAAMMARRRR